MPLTVWVLFCRVDSSPGKLVHVCSFSPALRFRGSNFSQLCRSSSLLSCLCGLFKPEKFSSVWKPLPRAHVNNPSVRMQHKAVMLTRGLGLASFALQRETHPSQQHFTPHAPLIAKRIFNNGPSTAAADWSGRE